MIEALKEILSGKSLSAATARSVIFDILNQRARPEQIGSLLTAFHYRPPTSQEISGMAMAFREKMISVRLAEIENYIDVCGTGGDGQSTFNISTTVAFVVAASGQGIAKHGNRAVSSRSGSFDVLEALEIPFADNEHEALRDLRNFNLSFLYAPSFHPAFRDLAGLRKALGVRTVFNVLGPLLNPAGVQRQLVGVYSRDLVQPVAEALGELGSIEAMVVHGDDGGDELSLCAPSTIAHLRGGRVTLMKLAPEDVGLKRANPTDLQGGSAIANARILIDLLNGKSGPQRDVVLLNSAAALLVGGKCGSIADGIEIAKQTLNSGRAHDLFGKMKIRQVTGAVV